MRVYGRTNMQQCCGAAVSGAPKGMTTMDKIPRPCRHGGCMVLTTEGYCEKHKAEHTLKRESSSARLYDHKWRKESKLFLAIPIVPNANGKGNILLRRKLTI